MYSQPSPASGKSPVDAEESAVGRAASLLASRYGIEIPAWRRPVLASRLASLTPDGDVTAGLARLARGDQGAWAKVCAALVVPETYFFRHVEHFKVLHQELTVRAQAGRLCRVVCAGCSTGEEVWSVAAVLASLPQPATGRHQVVGWDLCEGHLRRARDGRYGSWSCRKGLYEYGQWFTRDGSGWTVTPPLREHACFSVVNLVETPALVGSYDAVLFRNVALYFDLATTTRVVTALTGVLAPDGLLLVGPSDPVTLPADEWEDQRRDDGARVFRRRSRDNTGPSVRGRAAPQPEGDPAWRAGAASLVREPEPESRRTAPLGRGPDSTLRRERRTAATASSDPPTRVSSSSAKPGEKPGVDGIVPHGGGELQQVESFANAGEYLLALDVLRSNRRATSIDWLVWEAIVLLNLGRNEEAVAVLRGCVFLDPDNPVCRHWLAAAFRACGRELRAEREWRIASALELS